MSSIKANPKKGDGKTPKRALPSWMSARDAAADDNMDNDDQVNETQKKPRGQTKAVKAIGEESGNGDVTPLLGRSALGFSKLLDGVVFVLSGFVNPERGTLRSQALEMGAEYQPDWNSKCTLLVCAFPNTPKFRQVEADCGTIVSKDWITECYTQKKLVDIETYLMHIGKPWRKSNTSYSANQVVDTSSPGKACMQEVKRSQVELNSSTSSKGMGGASSNGTKERFSPSQVKKWAVDDLNRTLTWLESQEVKPEPNEIRNVAAEGILTCLQDAIDLLDKKQDLKQLTEEWSMFPRVVEELIKIQGFKNTSSDTEDDFHGLAIACKKVYMEELKGRSNISSKKNERLKFDNSTECDSDETIEMTEEEIDGAYKSIVSKMPKP